VVFSSTNKKSRFQIVISHIAGQDVNRQEMQFRGFPTCYHQGTRILIIAGFTQLWENRRKPSAQTLTSFRGS